MNPPAAMIPVYGRDGLCGHLAVDAWSARPPSSAIELLDGSRVIVPSASLHPREDGSLVLSDAIADFVCGARVAARAVTLPVAVERVRVDKQVREVGRVRIDKRVHERDEELEIPLSRDCAAVERIAVGRVVPAPEPVRYEGDTMIFPIHEEVVVTTRQLVLREELRVRIDRVTTHDRRIVHLRSEDITVVNTGPNPAGEHLS